MTNRLAVAVVVLTFAGCTCETVGSKDIKTSGLYADLEATASGNGKTSVKATLTLGKGSLTFLELSSGDTLTATSGTTSKAMSRASLFGSTWYETELPGDGANMDVKVALTRAADTSAPTSVVTLPAPFSLSTPTAGQKFSRAGAPVFVSWQGAGQPDEMRLGVSGSCIDSIPEAALSGDSGQHTLPALKAKSGEEQKSCDVVITMKRVRHGQVDPAYGKGGDFSAIVLRKVTFTSDP